MQALSVIECLEIDADGDRVLSQAELERGRAAIGPYLDARYQIDPTGPRSPWTLELVEGAQTGYQLVHALTTFPIARECEELNVRCRLFLEQNPLHRDVATIVWRGEEPAVFLFGEGVELWNFRSASARRGGVLASYFQLGVEHILGGWDHLAFLFALLVAARGLRSLLGVVTAFTAAHSITLALAAFDVVRLPARLVELAIALSIAYVAAEVLLVRRPGARWIEAFAFGLVHGLGFAGFLGESLMHESLKVTALVSFNLGVEVGQLAVVALATLAVVYVPGDRDFRGQRNAWLVPRWLRSVLAWTVLCAGLSWFLERAGWLSWEGA
ncbi:MAG: HupE/UreJ family protein [Planctomycetes bacterium]|nr:HupE/UreJ family protein [Planctomycetota bacterium]